MYNGDNAQTLVCRRYLYDAWCLIAEYDVNVSTGALSLSKSFTWGIDLSGTPQGAGGVGGLLQIHDHVQGKALLPSYDGNGNVAALLNAATGALEATYEYTSFGELRRAEGSYAEINPFRFSTKFTDDESGVIYYGYRYYSPRNGRFINRDPIEEAGGLNLYGFCGNGPITSWDYLGMESNTPTYDAQQAAKRAAEEAARQADLDAARKAALAYEADIQVQAAYAVQATSLKDTSTGPSFGSGFGGGGGDSFTSGLAPISVTYNPNAISAYPSSMNVGDVFRRGLVGQDGNGPGDSTIKLPKYTVNARRGWLETFNWYVGGAGAVAGSIENIQNGSMGFWIGRNLTAYPTRWGGNGATGGRLAFAGKMASTAKTAGNAFGALGLGISGYQAVQAYKTNNRDGLEQAGADIVAGGVGFLGPVGWAGSTAYFTGQLIDKWTGMSDIIAAQGLKKTEPHLYELVEGNTRVRTDFHFHAVIWTNAKVKIKREHLDWVPAAYLNNVEEFPFYQLCLATGPIRVVGFIDEENQIFNVVLIDPHHNIHKARKFTAPCACDPILCTHEQLLEDLDYFVGSKSNVQNLCKPECKILGEFRQTRNRNVIRGQIFLDADYIDAAIEMLQSGQVKTLEQIFNRGVEAELADMPPKTTSAR